MTEWSEVLAEHLCRQGIPRDQVRIIANWQDGALVRPVAHHDNPLRRAWGLDGRFVVGYSGNLGRVHELKTVLDAIALLQGPDAAELLDRGVLLHRDRPRSHGVPTSNEGLLAGYFVVRADSLEDAERIAADCPHLAHGGTVSVRPTGA